MTAQRVMPRYPIYIPSKGRSRTPLTAKALARDGVPFWFVVEPQEREQYAALFGDDHVLVLPWKNRGLFEARNWIKDHATAAGHARHWQLDDNMTGFYRRYRAQRVHCVAGVALRVVEDFVDRYQNVAIAGLQYDMFVPEGNRPVPPFYLNHHVYSCTLILNAIPHRWRLLYNDDTDICLQVLADGWCTITVNAFLVKKKRTMTVRGGNTDALYQGDGRLRMARSLERVWPGVVTVSRRFQRPQHVVAYSWNRFDNQLVRKDGVRVSAVPNEYGMKLVQVREKVRSPEVRALLRARTKEVERAARRG